MEALATDQAIASKDQEVVKVEARSVDVYYGEAHAIKGVDIDIAEKTVTSFIGPSGCGKSTFLRSINRMNDTIDSCRVTGTIKLDGEDIYDRRVDPVQLRARVGMVFQKPNPFPKSIYDNVAYGPKIHGMVRGKDEMDELVQESLRRAGLWDEVKDRLAQPGTGLSGVPAAAPVHRPRHRHQAGSPVDGRAVLGARSDRHRHHRGTDR